jgi:D-amino-acid dehydrogenase
MGASYGNAGMIAPSGATPLGMPGMLAKLPRMLLERDGPLAIRLAYLPAIAPWLLRLLRASTPARVEEISKGLIALSAASVECYRELLPEAAFRDLIQPRGLIYPYRSETSFAAAREAIELRRRRGVRLEVLGPAELGQLEPVLARDHARGVFFPDAHHTIDPRRLAQTLVGLLLAEGGLLERAEVDGLEATRGDRVVLRTAAGGREFARAVIAGGAWSRRLAAAAGARVPLDTERGYHLMLPRPRVAPRIPFIAPDDGIAVTPMAAGLRITSAVEFGGLSAPPNPRQFERIHRVASRIMPELDFADAKPWMGFRPSLPDSLPVIGAAPANPRVLLAFGHGHLGVTQAAITGLLVADLAAGRKPRIDPHPYRADRF